MEEDFARVKVVMSDEIGDGAVTKAGEGNRQGKGDGEGGKEGGKEGAGDQGGEAGAGGKPGLKSMLVLQGEGRVRKRSSVSVKLHQILSSILSPVWTPLKYLTNSYKIVITFLPPF